MLKQFHLVLPSYPRGYHLITDKILDVAGELPETGLMNIFIKHTSAGLTINENADPSVRADFESTMNHLVPENQSFYTHVFEGADDFPAHLKTSLVGVSLTIPIANGRLDLGTWQGIYLCEFRNYGGRRKLTITIYS